MTRGKWTSRARVTSAPARVETYDAPRLPQLKLVHQADGWYTDVGSGPRLPASDYEVELWLRLLESTTPQ